jgi:hypothetical protein
MPQSLAAQHSHLHMAISLPPLLEIDIPLTASISLNLEEHPTPYPKCELCGFQVPYGSCSHETTKMCRDGRRKKEQLEAAVRAHWAQAITFKACQSPLEAVNTFKYLGSFFTTTTETGLLSIGTFRKPGPNGP